MLVMILPCMLSADFSVQAIMVTWAQLQIPSPGRRQLTQLQRMNQADEHTYAEADNIAASTVMQDSISTTVATLTDSFTQLQSTVKNL